MDLASLLSHTGPASKPVLYTPGSQSSSSYFRTSSSSLKRSPQPPLSPPVDVQPKCSLPSISTLLEGADGAQRAAKRQRLSPPSHSLRDRDARLSAHYELPPTPPLRPGSGCHSQTQSRSPSESGSKPPSDRTSFSSQSSTAAHAAPAPMQATTSSSAAPYASPAPSISSYSSPIDAPPSSSLYYQRPPPPPPSTATFQPATPVTAPPMSQPAQHQRQPPTAGPGPAASPHGTGLITPLTPAWQHHHYFPPSSTAPYQQNHDRYICRTCHKAFSRPSSLRIHSHSHTGEKPFRCTHAGCGKAFSVRSNMKRHERGCHSGRPATAAVAAATALVS